MRLALGHGVVPEEDCHLEAIWACRAAAKMYRCGCYQLSVGHRLTTDGHGGPRRSFRLKPIDFFGGEQQRSAEIQHAGTNRVCETENFREGFPFARDIL